MITTKQVYELRQKTGYGMMLCKKALEATNGNFEEAITWCRKQDGGKVLDVNRFTNESSNSDEYEVIWYEKGVKREGYPRRIYKSGEHFVYHPYWEKWGDDYDPNDKGPAFVIDITIDENTKPTFTLYGMVIQVVKYNKE